MAETQGSRDFGHDNGYNPVEIPKILANTLLDMGGIQSVENQRMPQGMGTTWYQHTPAGKRPVGASSNGPSPKPSTPGRTK